VNLIRIKKNLGQMMSQWHLIKIAADAQAKVSSNVWINSFVRVNLHPKYRLSFEDWVKKLESKGVLASGRMFYDDDMTRQRRRDETTMKNKTRRKKGPPPLLVLFGALKILGS